MKKEAIEVKDNAGHRERLREKFNNSGLAGFHDYEIVEILLTLGTPRRDTKQAAKDAFKRFGSLRGVLDAPIEELQQIRGIGPKNAIAIKLIQEVAREYLKDKAVGTKYVSSSKEVYEHLYSSMRGLKKELFKVLYLDSQNGILASEDLFTGTVNSTAVFPREVIESALKHKAVSLIFVHNHPSGNPEPSQSDKDLTRDLVFAANAIDIKVLDHIIIGNDRYFSLAGEGLIEQSELNALNIKAGSPGKNTKRI
jgi:DNA repair protein RadC